MKKFKVLGVLFALLLVLGFTRVNAAMSQDDRDLLESLTTEVQSIVDDAVGSGQIQINTTVSGNTVTIALSDSLEFNVTLKDNIMTYENTNGSENETLALSYILQAITDSDGRQVVNNSDNYTFAENGLEMTKSGGYITYLKVDAKNATLSGGYTASNSSSSNTETTTTTTTTPKNPSTGVFVPVVGLSVLIVASVVCLIWISKKNVFKGF